MTFTSRPLLILLAVAMLVPAAVFAADTSTSSSLRMLPTEPVVQRDLSLGARGTDVTELQQTLIARDSGVAAKALADAGATGYFGMRTRAAVIEYQKAQSITPAYGYVGIKTRASIAGTVSHAAPNFTGKLEAVNTACFSDGICSVTVGGKKVIVLAGFRMDPPPVGKIIGADSIGNLEQRIGDTINVYAAPTTESGYSYTLYGNSQYYIEVLPKAPVGKPITVRGTSACLPPKDPSKPHIMLCALALKTADNKYYALKSDSNVDFGTAWGEGTTEVTGTLVKNTGESTWKSEGTITVTKIKTIK